MSYDKLFEKGRIGTLVLKNRGLFSIQGDNI